MPAPKRNRIDYLTLLFTIAIFALITFGIDPQAMSETISPIGVEHSIATFLAGLWAQAPFKAVVIGGVLVGLAFLIGLAAKHIKNKRFDAIADYFTDALNAAGAKLLKPELIALKAAAANGTLAAEEKTIADKWLALALPFVKRTPAGVVLLTSLDTFDPQWQPQIEAHLIGLLNGEIEGLLVAWSWDEPGLLVKAESFPTPSPVAPADNVLPIGAKS